MGQNVPETPHAVKVRSSKRMMTLPIFCDMTLLRLMIIISK